MAKESKLGVVSRFLLVAGEALLFAPKEACSAPASEEEKPSRLRRARPYFLKIKHSLARSSEESLILGALRRFVRGFFLTRMRAFGVFFFLCGFLQLLSYFFSKNVPLLAGDSANLVFGVTYIFLALLCTFAKGTVGDQVKKSFLFRGILAPVFGAQEYHVPSDRPKDSLLWMTVGGALCGLFSVLLSPVSVLWGVSFLGISVYVFHRPEVGLILAGGLFFVLPEGVLGALTAVTFLSLLCKCAVGKRSFSFALQDLIMALSLSALSAVFDGLMPARLLLLFCLYLLVPALLRNLQSLHDLVRFLTLTSGLAGLMVTVRTLLELRWPAVLWRFPHLEEILFLENSEETGILFAMFLPQVLCLARGTRKPAKKVYAFFCALFILSALATLRSGSVWLCALFGIVLYVLFAYRAGLLSLIVTGLLSFCALTVMPPEKTVKLLSFFGLQEDFFFTRGHSFLSVVSESLGVLPVLLSAAALIWFLYECFLFSRDATVAVAYPPVLAALCGVAVLTAAMFTPVEAGSVHLIFFLLLAAFPRVAAEASKREEIPLPY